MFKKSIVFILSFSLIFGGVMIAQAEEATSLVSPSPGIEDSTAVSLEPTPLVKPGLMPDNIFYPVKLFFENVGSAFTFGHLAKAKRFSNLAERRMAEAKIMTEQQKTKASEKALKRYQNILSNSLKQAEEASQAGQDASAIQTRISQMMENHLLVLDKVKEQVPEQAKAVIQKVEDNFQDHQEQILEHLSQKDPQKAVKLNQSILRRRLALLRQKISEKQGKEAEERLQEWQRYADLLDKLQQKGGDLDPAVLEDLDNQLQVLQKIQEETGEDSPDTKDAIQSIRGKVLQKQLKNLKSFEEKHPEKAAPLLHRLLQNRFQSLQQTVTEEEKPTTAAESPMLGKISRLEIKQIGDWLRANHLNQYGDPEGTNYSGGTPLFDESTGKTIDRLTYLFQKFPNRPWRQVEKEKQTQEGLQEYAQYLNLWQGATNRIRQEQKLTPTAEVDKQKEIYRLNNQRLEELNTLYQKIPEGQKRQEIREVIEGMMALPEETKQEMEMTTPQLRLEAGPKSSQLVPEKIRQAVRSRLQNKMEMRKQNLERTGSHSLEGKPNITPPQKIESPKAKSK